MPNRSKISELPPEVREALNARLVEQDFTGYEGLVEWLAELGYAISRSSAHRHGRELKTQFEEAMADARRTSALALATRESGREDDGALLAAASEIMQDKLVRVSLKLGQDGDSDPAETARALSTISRAFADVGRFDLSRQKWETEVAARARAELIAQQREKLDELGKSGAVPADVLAQVIKVAYDL